MKVLVLGATGPSGILICRYALQAGHQLVVYARNPSKLPNGMCSSCLVSLYADLCLIDISRHDDVQVIQGELTDAAALRSALSDCAAVLSALGPLNLWQKETVIANAFGLILDAMRASGVKRLIALSTPSVLDPNDIRGFLPWLIISMIKLGAPGGYKDIIAAGEVILAADDIEWTLVRVPFLMDKSNENTTAGYVGDGKFGWFLNRVGFARFVVEELERGEWVKRRPVLSSI